MSKKVQERPAFIRLGKGSFDLLEKSKIKGRFYCVTEDGVLVWINDNGKIVQNTYEDIDVFTRSING